MFKDAKQYVKRCDCFQPMGHLVQANETHLCPQVMIEPFEKWAIDFIGPINPTSLNKKHILVCTDFVTKWVAAKAVSFSTKRLVLCTPTHMVYAPCCSSKWFDKPIMLQETE